MANVVDNLLKLTDYPFAFSLTGLIFSIIGQESVWLNPSLNVVLPFITLAGLLGTSISITDPFGTLIRFDVRKGFLVRKSAVIKDWFFRQIHRAYTYNRPYKLFQDENLQKQIFAGARKSPTDSRPLEAQMRDYFFYYVNSLRQKAFVYKLDVIRNRQNRFDFLFSCNFNLDYRIVKLSACF